MIVRSQSAPEAGGSEALFEGGAQGGVPGVGEVVVRSALALVGVRRVGRSGAVVSGFMGMIRETAELGFGAGAVLPGFMG